MPSVRIISAVSDYQGEELRPGTVVHDVPRAIADGWIRNKKAVPAAADAEPLSNNAIGLTTGQESAGGLVARRLGGKRGKKRGR
jgi:hypothetical protein